MKKLTTVSTFLLLCSLFAQSQNIETEIKAIEQVEVKAVLAKDSVMLKKIWDKDLVVNSPANIVVMAKANPLDRPVMQKQRSSFTREVEYVTVRGDVVFSMGSETLVPLGDEPKAGQTVKRRYTNIWMKKDGEWKLVARHANVICEQK